MGQTPDTATASPLNTVEVKAYGQVRKLRDVPAAVSYISQQTLQRFSPASIVQAVNTAAGVRMEERSPGSYRFNIRGSALRSPFGVRNVKVYFNDLPFTDPGGHTYLNSLGYYNFQSLEILKGPGSSLYGAGTGGVLLIEGLNRNEEPGLFGELAGGSYKLRNAYASVTTGGENSRHKLGYQHQESVGYRIQSGLRRDVLSWTGQVAVDENRQLKTTFLYSDLFYETPGALTRAEFEKDPRLSRPAGGGFPSAVQNRASIRQRLFLAGASLQQNLSAHFSNLSTAYGAFNLLENPTIRNYGKSTEPHVGGRTQFQYQQAWGSTKLNLTAGAEWQQNFTTSNTYKNVAGQPDSLRTGDDIYNRQSFGFVQANFVWQGWELTAGASLNWYRLRFRRSVPAPLPVQNRNFRNELAPRLALARKFSAFTAYASVARGFSPPTSSELLPSGSNVNLMLEAEDGVNYDAGIRGQLFSHLTFDINGFYFRLKNTIVQRRDAGGGDYFINAGRTTQKGLETALNYLLRRPAGFLSETAAWLSHTWHGFRYAEFKQLTNDFSGKALPGIAPHTVSAGVDLLAKNGLLASVNYYYSDPIPLNDLNDEKAGAYHLLGAKLGFQRWLAGTVRLKAVLGADNLLNQRYSLGNDVNAFGGRYFNAAAGRNYYTSLVVQWSRKK